MPKDFNYKTALAIFLCSEKRNAFELNSYDIAYLFMVANAQDLNPSKQICLIKRPLLAKLAGMGLTQLVTTETKLASLGLIKLKKIWKMYRRILGEPICASPPQWERENRKSVDKSIVTTAMRVSSQPQCAGDHTRNARVTIEIVEKESIEKESSVASLPTTAFLQTLETYKPNQKLIDLSRSRGYEVEQLRMKFVALTKGSGRKYKDLDSAFEYFILSEKGSFKQQAAPPILATAEPLWRCEKCEKSMCICGVTKEGKIKGIAEIMAKLGRVSRNIN